MDDRTFEEFSSRLSRVSDVIAKLDPAIRLEAFNVLRPYVVAARTAPQRNSDGGIDSSAFTLSASEFFARFPQAKPADNAFMAAAYLFHERGKAPFSLDDLREVARNVGLTVPDRLDKTLLAAKRDGKALFRRVGTGSFEATVTGELYFRSTYPKSGSVTVTE